MFTCFGEEPSHVRIRSSGSIKPSPLNDVLYILQPSYSTTTTQTPSLPQPQPHPRIYAYAYTPTPLPLSAMPPKHSTFINYDPATMGDKKKPKRDTGNATLDKKAKNQQLNRAKRDGKYLC